MARAKKEPTLRSRVETITPEMASEWLDRTTKRSAEFRNRPVSQSVVNGYIEDIKNGNWEVNGESIKLSGDGLVVDGQHRLYAIWESGQEVRTLVVRGVRPESFATIDRGYKRTVGNILAMSGEMYANNLAAALNYVNRYFETDLVGSRVRSLSSAAALKAIKKHPMIRESVAVREWVRGVCPASVAIAAHYILGQQHPQLADRFFEKLGAGVNLDRDEPVRWLREKLLKRKVNRISRLSPLEMFALIFKTWKLEREGKKLDSSRTLYWRWQDSAEKKGEDFPYLAGHGPKKTRSRKKKSA